MGYHGSKGSQVGFLEEGCLFAFWPLEESASHHISRNSSGKPTSPKSIENVLFQDFIFSRKLEGFEIYTYLCFTRMSRVVPKTSVTCCWLGSLLDFIPLGTGRGSKSGPKYPKMSQILEVCQGSRVARRGPCRATWRRVLRTM